MELNQKLSTHTQKKPAYFENKTILLRNPWVIATTPQENQKPFELKDDRNTTYRKLRSAANSRCIEKFVAVSGYITKGEKFKIRVLKFHMKQLEKDKQIKPTVSRRETVTPRKEKTS